MTVAEPLALLLLLPALALVAWLYIGRGPSGMRLPGHWHRAIAGVMQPFMAGRVISRNRMPILFWVAVSALLVLGLARPVVHAGAPARSAQRESPDTRIGSTGRSRSTVITAMSGRKG